MEAVHEGDRFGGWWPYMAVHGRQYNKAVHGGSIERTEGSGRLNSQRMVVA
jgi:hypothetical protein